MDNIELSEQQQVRIRKIQLEMLKEVDRICNKYEINYVMGYGTMLGAVRHQGFIPWDDDIDVLMLRRDYIKFSEACQKELPEKYFLQDDCTDEEYLWGFAKMRNLNTSSVRSGQKHIQSKNGVCIDILPLDNVPDSVVLSILQDKYCFCLKKILWAKVGRYTEKRTLIRLLYKVLCHIPKRTVYTLRNWMIPGGGYFEQEGKSLIPCGTGEGV